MKKTFSSRLLNMFLAIVFVVAIIACGVTSYVFYKYYKASEVNYISERLKAQATDWNFVINYNLVEANDREMRARKSANDIVLAQLKPIQELIQKTLDDGRGTNTDLISKDLLDRLSHQTVGQTGYIWILDNQGKYILSKSRLRDGENILETKDAKGNNVIKDMVSKAQLLNPGAVDFHSYYWQNGDEKIAREKVAALAYFKDLGWTVGVSLYYGDLIDAKAKDKALDVVKSVIAAQKIGRTGYIWIVDSNGTYIVSKDRLRDGENIIDQKDYNGKFFVRNAIKSARAANGSAVGQSYLFKNADEKVARSKAVGLVYNKDLDWVIGVSSYYDDLDTTEAITIIPQLIVSMLGLSLLGFLLIRYYVIKKTQALILLADESRKIINGEMDLELTVIQSGDEVEAIREAMLILLEKTRSKRKV